jgi:hypothetical protein
MIERNEAELVKARDDLLDVMIRPGPGKLIRPPLFAEPDLRRALARRGWQPRSLFPLAQKIDSRLMNAIATCERKVIAHMDRLAFFRLEIASARLVQGALASGRAGSADNLAERQRLDHEAYDHFRAVLALPGHKDDLIAQELVAHQLTKLNVRDQAAESYRDLINILKRQEENPSRNMALARAGRCLAILRYPDAPVEALRLLSESISWLTRLGPPRDREFLDLAGAVYLRGIVHLRLGARRRGPEQLRLAQSYYRDLRRSLRARRPGLFQWMFETRRYSGHRVRELMQRAEQGQAQVEYLLKLNDKRQRLLISALQQGSGTGRPSRKRPHPQEGRSRGWRRVFGRWRPVGPD